jgi:hypothetical protein
VNIYRRLKQYLVYPSTYIFIISSWKEHLATSPSYFEEFNMLLLTIVTLLCPVSNTGIYLSYFLYTHHYSVLASYRYIFWYFKEWKHSIGIPREIRQETRCHKIIWERWKINKLRKCRRKEILCCDGWRQLHGWGDLYAKT